MTGTAATRIGVVTPLYNAADFIVETVESVLAQLAPGDVYVVVDDGSTDGGAELLAPYAGRLTLIRQDNAGEAAAVNRGVAALDTPVAGVVNADDPILPGLLDAIRAAFAADATLAGAYPDWRRIDESGRTLSEHRTREFDYAALLGEHLCIPGPGAFFRPTLMHGETIRDARAFGVTDYDFWLRFARANRNIVRVPQTLATWRSHAGGGTVTLADKRQAEARVEMIARYLARPDLPADARALAAQARSAAYYNAALVGLRGAGVPALRYALSSFAARLNWPRDIPRAQRRSLLRLAYASAQPLSGGLHGLLDPLLAPRHRRRAVVEQTFGVTPA